MREPVVNKDRVIYIEPEYRVCGVVVRNRNHGRCLMLSSRVAVIYGVVGALGLLMMVSYIYCS